MLWIKMHIKSNKNITRGYITNNAAEGAKQVKFVNQVLSSLNVTKTMAAETPGTNKTFAFTVR